MKPKIVLRKREQSTTFSIRVRQSTKTRVECLRKRFEESDLEFNFDEALLLVVDALEHALEDSRRVMRIRNVDQA